MFGELQTKDINQTVPFVKRQFNGTDALDISNAVKQDSTIEQEIIYPYSLYYFNISTILMAIIS